MLKEEQELRDKLRDLYGLDNMLVKRKITALVKAVRKDAREAVIAEGQRRGKHQDEYQWAAEVIIKP